ncbi:hypothetical protein sos41_33020 [Alphaproteobacteria bacterium SO-S41]|nr:hypothetical protein sos41_33020 [Alphaproteobacteria bacterium SO-S41]
MTKTINAPMKRRGRIFLTLFLGFVVVAGAASWFLPRYFEAFWFLEDIAAGPAPTDWKVMHRAPARSSVTWTVDGRAGSGDLYTPAERLRGRMVFVPGLLTDARNDARVIATAESFARAGFLTLVPQMEAFDGLKASPADITGISDAALWLSDSAAPGLTRNKVGIAALSYMSGPAILAASRAPLADRVDFVFFIGGYYSMTDVIRFVTTRKFRAQDSDPWSSEPPADYATWAFLKANALGLDDEADRITLAQIADVKLQRGSDVDVSGLIGRLGPDGQAVYALIANRDPDKVDRLIAALPAGLRTQLDALDPAKQDLSGFKGDALLVHGKDDPLIPSTESGKLAAALGGQAHLYILEQVTHVEVNKAGSIWDQLDMLFAGERLLGYRE